MLHFTAAHRLTLWGIWLHMSVRHSVV